MKHYLISSNESIILLLYGTWWLKLIFKPIKSILRKEPKADCNSKTKSSANDKAYSLLGTKNLTTKRPKVISEYKNWSHKNPWNVSTGLYASSSKQYNTTLQVQQLCLTKELQMRYWRAKIYENYW